MRRNLALRMKRKLEKHGKKGFLLAMEHIGPELIDFYPVDVFVNTACPRIAIDDAVKGRDFNPDLLIDLDNLANRGYTDGFYQRHETHELQTYRQRSSDQVKSQFVAEVKSIDSVNGAAELLAKNKFRVGDKMELITPNGNQKFVLKNLSDKNNTPIDEAPGGGWVVKTKLPLQADNRSFLTRFYKQ